MGARKYQIYFEWHVEHDIGELKGAVSRRWLAKINGAKKRLKLMLHDWKKILKQGKDVLHNEGIINSISYFIPILINCWQTVFQVRAYFRCAVEPWLKVILRNSRDCSIRESYMHGKPCQFISLNNGWKIILLKKIKKMNVKKIAAAKHISHLICAYMTHH